MAGTSTFAVPTKGEFDPYYARYIDRVADGAVLQTMDAQLDEVPSLLRDLSEDEALARYAPGKWSIKEVVEHLSDVERIFGYRALRIARGDETPLSGFDENAYVTAAGSDVRPLAALIHEWEAVRRSTLALFRGFTPEAIGRAGSANGVPVTARALAYITVGHVAHHLEILRERYLKRNA